MQIEEGRYYKTRDGRKLGPAKYRNYGTPYFEFDGPHSAMHHPDGRYAGRNSDHQPNLDLISEWPTGPVVTETVTKTRIVPGTYDGVIVWENPRGKIEINFHLGDPTPDQLDAAAAVLSALAKGLRDA